MSTGKKQDNQKKVLDALKEQLQPITDGEGNSLTGGFASTVAEDSLSDLDLNGVSCGSNKSGCNSSSCGSTPTKPATE